MTWTKLSDDFGDDCWGLSDAAFRLHVEGLLCSNRKLLDLSIPKDDLRRFAKHPEAVGELVEREWWTYCGDQFRDPAPRDPSTLAGRRLDQQAVNRVNGRKVAGRER